jgi:hypothetical protein
MNVPFPKMMATFCMSHKHDIQNKIFHQFVHHVEKLFANGKDSFFPSQKAQHTLKSKCNEIQSTKKAFVSSWQTFDFKKIASSNLHFKRKGKENAIAKIESMRKNLQRKLSKFPINLEYKSWIKIEMDLI